ncbi:MAG: protocadherin [Gimesia sp.]|nr:protocadherin [Gimesia sp.]
MNFNKRPTQQGLNNFLGLPSDAGHNAVTNSHPQVQDFTGRDTINRSSGSGSGNIYHGPDGGVAGGGTYTGPRGNTVTGGGAIGPDGGHAAGGTVDGKNGGTATGGRVVGPDGGSAAGGRVVGPDGGTAAGGRVVGRDGGSAAGGRVVGPDGGKAAGGIVRGPNGGGTAGGVVRGPDGGYAAGFVHVPPSTRYYHGAVIRGGFAGYGMYYPGWYAAHPGVWYAPGWPAGYAWSVCTWDSMMAWLTLANSQPLYYDYGNNVVYQDNSVYVNNQDVGTAAEYTQQASQLASQGASADVSDQKNWMPLGVFALSPSGQTKSDSVVELAVDANGIIRGNYTDTKTNKTQQVQGSVDKKTQRAAWTVGDDKNTVYDTGIYNLTKDEAPLLVHTGKDETQQWLMVRITQKDKDKDKTSSPPPPSE